MNSDNFRIASLQISIFTPAVLFSKKTKILERLMRRFANSFDGDTLSIPIPKSAPKEIPRITLHSADQKLKLEIAESRVNFHRYRKDDDVEIDTNQIVDLCIRILREYKNCTQAIIGRLALVVVKFLEKKNPGLALVRHFCKKKWTIGPFSRPESFEIHSQEKYPLEGFNINSWVRCRTGRLVKNNEPALIVTQDINTLTEELEERDFSIEQLRSFLKIAHKEQEHILRKYFPKE